MPELPDVEAARRLVERTATGTRIAVVVCPDPSALRNATLRRFRHAVGGTHVRTADRRGKWLIIGTDGASIVVHLGMTGALRWEEEGECRRAPHTETDDDRFCRLALVTDRGALRFIDRRKLGGVWLATDDTELHDLLGDLGSDALGLPCDELRAILGASRKQLKAALMDQSLVAGLGNMLSDEILWRARLHPTRVASTLAPAEGEAVVRCRAGSPGRVGSCRGDPSHAVVAVRSARHRRPDLSTVR